MIHNCFGNVRTKEAKTFVQDGDVIKMLIKQKLTFFSNVA